MLPPVKAGQISIAPMIAVGVAGMVLVMFKVRAVLVVLVQLFFETTEIEPETKLLLYVTVSMVSVLDPMMLMPAVVVHK